jgi:hypothetical protein
MQLRLFQKWVKKDPSERNGYILIKTLPDENGIVRFIHKGFKKFKILNGTVGVLNINLLYKDYKPL